MNTFQKLVSQVVGLDREVERRIEEEKREWDTVVIEAWRGNMSSSGANVTPENSIRMAAVYACVQRISRDLAGLPLPIYEKMGDGRRRADEHYLYQLLNVKPNPRMTAYDYREMLMSHLLLRGNAYSQIIYDGSGQIVELWPLNPSGIQGAEYRKGIRYYQYQNKDGKMKWMSEVDIWHLKGLGSGDRRFQEHFCPTQ